MDINSVSQVKTNPKMPKISPGDTVKVSFRIKEANRERLQTLPGLVVRVISKGYLWGDIVLVPAKVAATAEPDRAIQHETGPEANPEDAPLQESEDVEQAGSPEAMEPTQ